MTLYKNLIFATLLLISLYLANRYNNKRNNIEYFYNFKKILKKIGKKIGKKIEKKIEKKKILIKKKKPLYLYGIKCSYVDKNNNRIVQRCSPSIYISKLLQNLDCTGTEVQQEIIELANEQEEERKESINELNEELVDTYSQTLAKNIQDAYQSLKK